MNLLPVLQYPDPGLKLVAKHVKCFDADLASLCANMLETMYINDGVGLAATQVGITQRIIVLDISPEHNQPLCMINPKILYSAGSANFEEGCLSFPGIYAKVKRQMEIRVEYYTPQGAAQELTTEGILAICIQHEIDHLEGITFFDRLSPLKKQLLRNRINKLSKV